MTADQQQRSTPGGARSQALIEQLRWVHEPRPRAGVLRTREFIMKDSYSFDRDEEGLDASYELHIEAYDRDLRPLRAALVPGRVRRRHDGRPRRARVHGAVPGGRERGGPLGRRLRGQRRDRDAARRRSPTFPSRRSKAGAGRDTLRAHDRRGVVACSASTPATLIKALPVVTEDGGMRLALVQGRPPPQRDQAPERARHAVPARDGGGDPVRVRRRARVHRPGRRRRRGDRRRIARAGHLRRGRQPRRLAPARRRARPRLQGRALPTSARSRRATAARSGGTIRDRAGDRGRQHLQARHPLLGAARRHLPRRARQGAPDPDGQLRHRPGADRRGRDRAGSRRARDLLADARSRRSTCSWSGSASRAPTSTSSRSASTTSSQTTGFDVLYDDRDASPGEKFVEAELLGCPAAGGRRQAQPLERRARGPGPARHRGAHGAARLGAPTALRELWKELP